MTPEVSASLTALILVLLATVLTFWAYRDPS